MKKNILTKKVLIIGGGFAGINCALQLEKHKSLDITLVSDTTHFEYHAALYRLATGTSPFEVCIPLKEIFHKKNVEIVKDKITNVDLSKKTAISNTNSKYTYDYLVLAVGSETAYFNIEGLKENSFGLKTINDALVLKKHIHKMFDLGDTHIVIVGAGPTGTELSAQLAYYTKKLALCHKVDTSQTRIDLVEREKQIMKFLPEDFSEKIKKRLLSLKINVLLNEAIVKEDIENVYLKDMKINAKTVIWTAGVKANQLISKIEGLIINDCGKVEVDEYLQASNLENVFIAGDLAHTKYSGMAQTALKDGAAIAKNILRKEKNKQLVKINQTKPIYAIPVGHSWAAVVIGNLKFYGKTGWYIRRLLDLKVFLTILPFKKALTIFSDGSRLCETCEICSSQ